MKQHIAALAMAVWSVLPAHPAQAGDVLVFAASSVKEALEEACDAWSERSGNRAVISLAGSSTLARQIQAGAPADLLLSANENWMNVLEADGLLREGTRTDLLANSLVVIAGDPAADPLDLLSPDALATRLGDGRLAMALVDAVPAGIYGKAALETLGLWNSVAPRVAQADNVRAALALVAAGEAPLGIVYATDARAEPRVGVVATIPADTHPPIRYPLAVMNDAGAPAAELARFLAGAEAGEIFRAHGFEIPAQGAQ
ncbi:molybdate ABC transporter substrate-binding protein [Aliiruegeria lutimaris]|uniref:Molybdate transport system substrate-binding protein n=1 Tax=Aliiruegeria lutimaris TaxID=571298 RepID=A0A1G8PSX5_9RHOB|nr:molybdate ABC transporter substrate-binding protein [Aliiruegeria lutimaris]SDI95604.1 molybdate transport system substrate-binding protein [Aliiruegeria lutimaris]